MRTLRTFAAAVLTVVLAAGTAACAGEGAEDPDATTTSLGADGAENPADGSLPPGGEAGAPGSTQPGEVDPGATAPNTHPAAPGSSPSNPEQPADRAARSELRNAFTAARVISTDYEGRFQKNDAGDPIDAEALSREEDSLKYGPSGSASADVVSVLVRDVSGRNSDIWLVTASTSGAFYCIHGTTDGRVTFGAAAAEAEAVAACDQSSWPGE